MVHLKSRSFALEQKRSVCPGRPQSRHGTGGTGFRLEARDEFGVYPIGRVKDLMIKEGNHEISPPI
jgi:hypothetical protein